MLQDTKISECMLLAVHKNIMYFVFIVLSGWFHDKCELCIWRAYPCLIDSQDVGYHEVCIHCMSTGSSSRDAFCIATSGGVSGPESERQQEAA